MPEEPKFEGIAQWPEQPAPMGHNQPPLELSLVSELEDALAVKGLTRRVGDIINATNRAPDVVDDESAGAVRDLIAQAKEAHKAIEAEREVLNRPLLNAQRAMKGKADSLIAPMDAAIAPLRAGLDAFMAERQEVAHGEMGTRVGARETWDFEVTDYAKLPQSIKRHPTVTEAIGKVIRGLIKGGERKIAGVKIWPTTKATIR